MDLVPSRNAIAKFTQLVDSLKVDGQGGDESSETIRMHLFGETNQRIEFPESTGDCVYDISRELFALEPVRRYFEHEDVVDRILAAACAAAITRDRRDLVEEELGRAYAEFGATPAPIRMLFQLAPRLHFAEESVVIGDVRLYRATEKILHERWPRLFEWDAGLREHAIRDIRDKMVAELTVIASPRRGEELAAERLMATLGIIGIEYTHLSRDWPIAGLLPSHSAARVSEHASGRISFGPATFFESGLMQFPVGYLSEIVRRTGQERLAEAIAERRTDDVSRRLLVALQWWTSGNEPNPWAMRFSRYMTVFETLFGRKAERYTP